MKLFDVYFESPGNCKELIKGFMLMRPSKANTFIDDCWYVDHLRGGEEHERDKSSSRSLCFWNWKKNVVNM